MALAGRGASCSADKALGPVIRPTRWTSTKRRTLPKAMMTKNLTGRGAIRNWRMTAANAALVAPPALWNLRPHQVLRWTASPSAEVPTGSTAADPARGTASRKLTTARLAAAAPASPTAMAPRAADFTDRTVRTSGKRGAAARDRKSTRLNSSHLGISYAVFCLKKKKHKSNK